MNKKKNRTVDNVLFPLGLCDVTFCIEIRDCELLDEKD